MSLLSALVLALATFCLGGYFGGPVIALAWDAGQAAYRWLLAVLNRRRHGRLLFRVSIQIAYQGKHAAPRGATAPQQLPVLSGVVVKEAA